MDKNNWKNWQNFEWRLGIEKRGEKNVIRGGKKEKVRKRKQAQNDEGQDYGSKKEEAIFSNVGGQVG